VRGTDRFGGSVQGCGLDMMAASERLPFERCLSSAHAATAVLGQVEGTGIGEMVAAK
jgi:hypothetical protein